MLKPPCGPRAPRTAPRGRPGEECFTGYGVMGFRSVQATSWPCGILPASSIGPGYTSVWIRDPAGAWSMHGTVAPDSPAPGTSAPPSDSASTSRISLTWSGSHAFTVDVDGGAALRWQLTLRATTITRLMSVVSGAVPERLWRSRTFLRAMGAVAGPLLGGRHIGLTGLAPNGQRFAVHPRRMWFVADSRAVLKGATWETRGPAGPGQVGRLLDPERGILMVGSAVFEPFDAAAHVAAPDQES